MRWVTRERPKTDRIACPWLIRRFIDPDAEIVYVASDRVLAEADREDSNSFDAEGAEYTHRGLKCSFETLIDEFDLGGDPALVRLAQIVHAADVSEDRHSEHSAIVPGSVSRMIHTRTLRPTRRRTYEPLRAGTAPRSSRSCRRSR